MAELTDYYKFEGCSRCKLWRVSHIYPKTYTSLFTLAGLYHLTKNGFHPDYIRKNICDGRRKHNYGVEFRIELSNNDEFIQAKKYIIDNDFYDRFVCVD